MIKTECILRNVMQRNVQYFYMDLKYITIHTDL